MLTKQRQEMILELLDERGSITVAEASDLLKTSESTIRRDITTLDREGKLTKVFGGAVMTDRRVTTLEYTVAQKNDLNRAEKQKIAAYAATLIGPDEFIFLDAGTTTGCVIDCISATNVTVVTNAVMHARQLAMRGIKVLLIGGELKASTEAIIGVQAMQTLKNYHFTKGFFGANGVTKNSGCTTPDANEALVKQTARAQCKESYILCDYSKFGNTSSVTFAPFSGTTFITDRKISGFEGSKNIIVAR